MRKLQVAGIDMANRMVARAANRMVAQAANPEKNLQPRTRPA